MQACLTTTLPESSFPVCSGQLWLHQCYITNNSHISVAHKSSVFRAYGSVVKLPQVCLSQVIGQIQANSVSS